jgi:hypothetical protein
MDMRCGASRGRTETAKANSKTEWTFAVASIHGYAGARMRDLLEML